MSKHAAAIQRIGISLIGLVLLVGLSVTALPRQAHAQWATFDLANVIQNTLSAVFDGEDSIKEYILDPLARYAAETVRQSLLRSIVNWANNGFDGSPAFIPDLKENLRGLGDFVVDSFIDEFRRAGYIDSPFRDGLAAQLRGDYRRLTSDNGFFRSNRYNLDRYAEDDLAFLRGDFKKGGIRAWIATWQNEQNNPFGAYQEARDELSNRVKEASGLRMSQLSWSNGILSWCGPAAPAAPGTPTPLSPPPDGCKPGQQVRTAGSFIHETITKASGSDIDMIVSADELDELFGAVLNGLMKRMTSDGGFAGGGGGTTTPDDEDRPTEGAAGAYGARLAGIVQGLIGQITVYQSNWQTLLGAASAAVAECASGGNPTLRARASAVVTEGTAALTKGDTALARLNALLPKLQAPPGPDQDNLLEEGIAEYEELINARPPVLPTAHELSSIGGRVQANENITPPTTLMEMRAIVENNCR